MVLKIIQSCNPEDYTPTLTPLYILCAGMLDIAKREFEVLAVDGSNYLTWATVVEIKLDGMSLGHTIVQPEAGKDERKKPDKARVLHFLRHHLHPDLKSKYMMERDPLVLWQPLKDRFSQQLTIVLPRAQQAWITLRFQDYKSVAAYNSALHRIVTKMRLCGQKITDADMIKKTLIHLPPWQHSTATTIQKLKVPEVL
jgi:hypothetical protein